MTRLRVHTAAVPLVIALMAAAASRVASAPPRADDYRALVDAFADAPNDAIPRMLAMPPDVVARSVHDAVRTESGWSADELDRALLMHSDAALTLAAKHSEGAGREQALADEIATAAARLAGNEWFVHRWYKAYTARVGAPLVADHWHHQHWFRTGEAIDRGRELETTAAAAGARLDTTVFDPSEFKQAAPLFERGLTDQFLVAAVHLGRIRMLQGDDGAATRLFEIAAHDPKSRVNRYLAELFLGSLVERDGVLDGAERHYKAARQALPRAQSGRFALAALLARTGREVEARRVMGDSGTSPFYDPWWSYLHGTSHDHAFIFAELHSEVCR